MIKLNNTILILVIIVIIVIILLLFVNKEHLDNLPGPPKENKDEPPKENKDEPLKEPPKEKKIITQLKKQFGLEDVTLVSNDICPIGFETIDINLNNCKDQVKVSLCGKKESSISGITDIRFVTSKDQCNSNEELIDLNIKSLRKGLNYDFSLKRAIEMKDTPLYLCKKRGDTPFISNISISDKVDTNCIKGIDSTCQNLKSPDCGGPIKYITFTKPSEAEFESVEVEVPVVTPKPTEEKKSS